MSGATLRRLACCALALGVACSGDTPPASRERLAGDLDLEIREHATLEVERVGERLTVTLTPSAGFDLLTAGARLVGSGTLERFDEADTELVTARFEAPPLSGGRCGAEGVSLALSLARRAGAARVAGSLAASCGADSIDAGRPVRILRLAGPLE